MRPRRAQGRLVVHALPADLPRGAQIYARAICDRLDGHPDRHEALTLFATPPTVLHAEHRLEVRDGLLRRLGFSPKAAWRLRSFVRRERPAVVVSHGGGVLRYLPFAVPRSTPTVYYRIGTANEHLDGRLRRWAYTFLVRRARLVLAVSDDTAAEATRIYGIPRDAIVVIPNARDPERYGTSREAAPDADGRAGGVVTVGFVGQLTESKGADRFARVVGALAGEGLDVRGLAVGPGPLLDELAGLAAPGSVEALGYRSDVADLLARVHVLVVPGIDREGMPGVLIEAGLSGLAVVATDLPGVRDVVEDGRTGIVVDPTDDAALRDAVRRLVIEPASRAAMGAAALERCTPMFSLGPVCERWQEVLAPLLVGPDPEVP